MVTIHYFKSSSSLNLWPRSSAASKKPIFLLFNPNNNKCYRERLKSIHIENANQIPLLFKRILSYGRQNYNHCESAAPCCWKNASSFFLRMIKCLCEKKNSDHSTFWREKQKSIPNRQLSHVKKIEKRNSSDMP